MNFREKFIDDDLAYCVEFYAFLNSYEKEFISGLDHIGRFAGIAVVTNSVELVDKDKPANASNIISVQELRRRYPWEFKIAHPASHQEVQDMGKLANERLGKALVQMVKSL